MFALKSPEVNSTANAGTAKSAITHESNNFFM